MSSLINHDKRTAHFNTAYRYEEFDDFNYHLFGADKTLKNTHITNSELLYHYYRFKIEEKIIKYLVKKYCSKKIFALDCGSGTGRVSNILSFLFKDVDAFDLSSHFTIENKRRFAGIRNIKFSTSNFYNFEPRQEKYDLVFAGGVFMYLNDDEMKSALDKIKGCLDLSGILITRDSISRAQEQVVDNLKVYRSEKNYLTFFNSNFISVVRFNSTNRNIWCSIFQRLPLWISNRRQILLCFMKLLDVFLIFDFYKILYLGGCRHPLAHQQFYVFKKSIIKLYD